MRIKTIALLLASCFMLVVSAQEKGKVKVEGYTIHLDSKGKKTPVAEASINVYKGAEKTDEIKSNKKGKYSIDLEYGYTYKVACEGNEGYIDMCISVEAKIPPAKQDINATIGLDFIMIGKDNTDIDTLKFKFPFTKFKFDGNKKFVDDPKYLSDFEKGLFKEYKDAVKAEKKRQADQANQSKLSSLIHYIMAGGKLLAGDPPNTPINNMKINLKDDKGTIVETTTTNKFGKFSFSKLQADKNYVISMDENDSMKLMGTKITMYNKYGKQVMVTTSGDKGGFKFQLLGSDKVTISQLEMEDNTLMIAGTLQALKDDKDQPVAKQRIVLANPTTGEIYEVVETDENGKFVFAKLPPDKNFVIRLEENSADLAGLKITLKDPAGNEITSGNADGFGKFRFQLLGSDKEMLNNMEIEESSLKMDLVGKFLNGTTSEPLAGIKIDLLNDKGDMLQSATSNDKGAFVFKNLVLYGGYFFKMDETDAKISSLTSIILAEVLSGKQVKEYTITAGQAIKHRFLASDQKRIGRLYMK